MLSQNEMKYLEKLLRAQIAEIDGTVYLDDDEINNAARRKEAIKSIATKMNEMNKPRQLVAKTDQLDIDQTLPYDEIIFARAGKPVARIKRPS